MFQLTKVHSAREKAIRSCIDVTRANVRRLAETDHPKILVKEQTKVWLAMGSLLCNMGFLHFLRYARFVREEGLRPKSDLLRDAGAFTPLPHWVYLPPLWSPVLTIYKIDQRKRSQKEK